MNIGNLFLYSNLALLLISLILFKKSYLKWLIKSAVLLLTLAMVLLLYYFMASDFGIAYVFSFSSTDLPLMYKISAVLTGQSGTFLFWAFMINIQAWWLVGKRNKEQKIDEILKIVLLIGIAFVSFTLLNSPFNSFASVYAEEISKMGLSSGYVPAEGRGLSLALQDPWMAVHPPLTFMGYGLLAIPFAAAIMHFRRGYNFIEISNIWAKLSWFFLTLAIATGGYWTYKIFAGADYWAWDPVETSSLIPWLTLTAYLHIAQKYQEFKIFAPALLVYSFILTIYATFVTRSGFWPSVHAFAGTDANTALLAFLMVLTVLSSAVILIKFGRKENNFQEARIFTSHSLNYYTIILLSIVSIVIFFGITYPAIYHAITGNQAIMGRDFFNIWTLPFTLGLIVVIAVCTVLGVFPEKTLKKYTAFVLAASLVLGIIGFGYPFTEESLFSTNPGIIGTIATYSYLPILIFSLLAIGYIFYRDIITGKRSLRNVGGHVIHLGVILIFFGLIMSTSFDTQYNVRFSVAEVGKTKNVGDGYGIALNNLITGPAGLNFVQSAHLSVFKDGILIANGTSSFVSTPTGAGNLYAMIQHGIFSDVYVVFHSPYAEPNPDFFTLPLTLRILPFANFIWIGVVLFSIGMGIRILF